MKCVCASFLCVHQSPLAFIRVHLAKVIVVFVVIFSTPHSLVTVVKLSVWRRETPTAPPILRREKAKRSMSLSSLEPVTFVVSLSLHILICACLTVCLCTRVSGYLGLRTRLFLRSSVRPSVRSVCRAPTGPPAPLPACLLGVEQSQTNP